MNIVQLQIGSVNFPLVVSAATPPKIKTVDTLAALVKLGTYFYTSSSFKPVSIKLLDFQNWLSTNGYSIPDELSGLIRNTTININHINISAGGIFNFNFDVDFNPPLGDGLTKGLIDVKNIGLAIARTKSN